VASLRDIKTRIASTQKTQKITKALQMVSAAKFSRAQANAQAYIPYTEKVRSVVASIAAGNKGAVKHPMLESREVKKTGYLVITADLGKAGGYNNNVLRRVQDMIDERHSSKDDYTVIVIGKMGVSYFQKRNMPIAEQLTGLPDQPNYDDVKALAKRAVELFADEKIDELYMVYNHFVSAISQQIYDTKLLPLTDLNTENTETRQYEYEPSAEDVLKGLLPLYIEGLIYGALLDAKAAEHAARMTAMRSATDNAEEMIDSLTLSYNRARQAAITKEISEIVGGAAALE
jgi:F-type H+-transporting ATPase subunit gamma